jgi:hypothetical protein
MDCNSLSELQSIAKSHPYYLVVIPELRFRFGLAFFLGFSPQAFKIRLKFKNRRRSPLRTSTWLGRMPVKLKQNQAVTRAEC